jgi:hypothetical protein
MALTFGSRLRAHSSWRGFEIIIRACNATRARDQIEATAGDG